MKAPKVVALGMEFGRGLLLVLAVKALLVRHGGPRPLDWEPPAGGHLLTACLAAGRAAALTGQDLAGLAASC